ncbi:zinc finger BED domain-containing protein RICESLEEPER 2 [Tanacetum coccineum]|uniref:Zinc finger BED domain-containing protein RICESLEEPER 2 n=1 Tax=Tanacetum coccineum TaxID=301880 RepID=A0ABQ5H8J9_9ASTR
MTMTVDNAPSNDKAIGYLIKKFPNARLYDDGKYFHVRCMAHVLNLIVQEGLKVKNYHVECLSNAVRYIRQSTQRIKKFKACMKESGLESNRFLSDECPTRWNSKHDMLKITIELRDAFFKYELVDDCYYRDLGRVPEHSDFGACKDVANGGDNDFVYDFLNLEESGSIESDGELTIYLNEPRIRYTRDFDILEWWKLSAPRFPIVSQMAKVIMEYLVKNSKKTRILELKRRYLKITVLTPNMLYPSRKIWHICACTSQKITKKTISICRLRKKYCLSLKIDMPPRDK